MKKFVKIFNEAKYGSEDRTAVVFGCGRGGTSALAGGLRELGFVFPNAHPLKHEWSPLEDNDDGRSEKFRDKVSTFNKNFPRWGWKSPRDIFLANNFLPILRNPVVIIVVRNPLAVADSMLKHDGIELEVGVNESIKAYSAAADFIYNTYYPCAVLSFEDLIINPSVVLGELNEVCDLGASVDELNKARKFISQPLGYAKISSEPNPYAFNRKELDDDRRRAHNAIYPPLVVSLSQVVTNINLDISIAQGILRHRTDELFNFSLERVHQLGLDIDPSILYQLITFDRDNFDRLLDISILLLERSSSNNASRVSPVSPEIDITMNNSIKNKVELKNISLNIYRITRQQYLEARKKRQNIQSEIDELIARTEILKSLIDNKIDNSNSTTDIDS